jgi:hypothetical protein
MRREDGGDGSSRQIRQGILAAERIVKETPATGGAWAWLKQVEGAITAEQGRLNSLNPHEDDRTTAGLATIRTEAEETRGWLTRLIIKAVGLLLVLALVVARFGFST